MFDEFFKILFLLLGICKIQILFQLKKDCPCRNTAAKHVGFHVKICSFVLLFQNIKSMEAVVKKSSMSKKNMAMTSRQIRKKVGEAWAFLENPVYEKGALTSASLLYYNADKAKVLEQISKYEKGHFAVKFFGKIDEQQVYIL